MFWVNPQQTTQLYIVNKIPEGLKLTHVLDEFDQEHE